MEEQDKSHPTGHTQFRFDVISEVVSSDDTTGVLTLRWRPDPRRYEWVLRNGQRLLYDRLDDLHFTEECLAQFPDLLKDQPVNFQPQLIQDAKAYVCSRHPAIRSMLSGRQPVATFADPSEDFLESLEADELEFVILSLDLVGSTKLAATLPEAKYSRLVSTALFEIAEAVPLFHGHVLKYTGDGIIAYFPAPGFINKHDLAIDCALTLRQLVHGGINPVLVEAGYEPLEIRIGLDSGEASVVVMGSPTTKQHKDVVGSVVSLACKIQTLAPVGGITLGDTTLRNLHTTWRAHCHEVTPVDWDYIDPETHAAYRVHAIDLS